MVNDEIEGFVADVLKNAEGILSKKTNDEDSEDAAAMYLLLAFASVIASKEVAQEMVDFVYDKMEPVTN